MHSAVCDVTDDDHINANETPVYESFSISESGSNDYVLSPPNPCVVFQVGFPLQLYDLMGPSMLLTGPAFSWGGDYSQLQDITDAVKHGHSVDWQDVHNKSWKTHDVQVGQPAALTAGCRCQGFPEWLNFSIVIMDNMTSCLLKRSFSPRVCSQVAVPEL